MLRTLLSKWPQQRPARRWLSILLTLLWVVPVTLWGIYDVETYGMALFILTPIFIGLSATLLFGFRQPISKKEATAISFQTLGVFVLGLLVFAIEGLICVAMAAPLGLLWTWMGSLLGLAILRRRPDQSLTAILLLGLLIPTTAWVEKDVTPALTEVKTKVLIEASPDEVWEEVLAFSPLDEPTEWLFRLGIAYPINATIEGQGVGAIRHCNFNTGSFVEPITTWEPGKLLQFDVLEQPAPMKELSFWDIDAPHLHDYFVSKKGQFKLTELAPGRTELEGTTWYYHRIQPAFYWRWWSESIVHQIHLRVLNHIKASTEKGRAAQ